jgi:hypothetical protein
MKKTGQAWKSQFLHFYSSVFILCLFATTCLYFERFLRPAVTQFTRHFVLPRKPLVHNYPLFPSPAVF